MKFHRFTRSLKLVTHVLSPSYKTYTSIQHGKFHAENSPFYSVIHKIRVNSHILLKFKGKFIIQGISETFIVFFFNYLYESIYASFVKLYYFS